MKWFVSVLLVCAAFGVQAREAGDWLIRAGAHTVQPKSDNGTVDALPAKVEVDDAISVTFNVTYMVTSNLGLELLAALPFEHDIDIGGATAASTKHLPPTLSLVYTFNPGSKVEIYAGLGLNYTLFFDEDTKGALNGAKLRLNPSWGPAVVAGVDINLTEKWFLNADVRWFDIDTDAKVTAPGLTIKDKVSIDPWAVGVNIGYRI